MFKAKVLFHKAKIIRVEVRGPRISSLKRVKKGNVREVYKEVKVFKK